MTAIAERMVGQHRVVVEGEGVIAMHFAAPPTEDEMRALIDAEVELVPSGVIFLIIDLRRVDNMSPGARRAVGEAAKKLAYQAFAMYGASFQMRVMAKLINGALSLFSKSQIPQQFFDSHEEARAWIDELRRKAAVGA